MGYGDKVGTSCSHNVYCYHGCHCQDTQDNNTHARYSMITIKYRVNNEPCQGWHVTIHIVTCQAHPVLVRIRRIRWAVCSFKRISGPVSCRCPGGSLETRPRWHETIWLYNCTYLVFLYPYDDSVWLGDRWNKLRSISIVAGPIMKRR